VNPASPYFVSETGDVWTPIGQNDGITWPELHGLYRRRDVATAEDYLRYLADHGVTVLRLMMEYCQGRRHFVEGPAGRFRPGMVQLWDDLFGMCEKHGLRILLTPVDTFWMWINWDHHPWNAKNGGPCADRAGMLECPDTRRAIHARLNFAVERWSGSGALFAWDLWNEIHPGFAHDSASCFEEFIGDLSRFVRTREMNLYGRAHPQTVSMFGPHMTLHPAIPGNIYRHPALDVASTHFYEEGTIDYPLNTVDAAMAVARLMREALAEVPEGRPFFDSEHGPIHSFKDHHITFAEEYDDEYFRHMQWAHLCAGGAGGGMRWPNRSPHSLTRGMREAQRAMAQFLPLLDFTRFRRRNRNEEVSVSKPAVRVAACADAEQALLWLVRADRIRENGMLDPAAEPIRPAVSIPGLREGSYNVTAWDTLNGRPAAEFVAGGGAERLTFDVPGLATDLALAVRRVN
jgi:hypothetical protein